jgi:HEAT repeat protein
MNQREKKELLAKLEKDPQYLAIQRKQMAKPEVRANYIAMAPILKELGDAGFAFGSLKDLAFTREQYREALPILLRWLRKAETADVKSVIVEALSVRWARPAAIKPLIEEFKRVDDSQQSLKWSIGAALGSIADETVVDDILELVQDTRHGTGRQMIVQALGKMKDPRAVDAAIALLGDDDVAGHAIYALGKLKAERARLYIEPFLRHERSFLRKEAKKALGTIGKAAQKPVNDLLESRGQGSKERVKKRLATNKDLQVLQRTLTDLALKVAAAYETDLDFSIESVQRIEEILAPLSDDYQATKNEDGLHGLALELAAYIITVIEKNISAGRWQRNSKEFGKDSYPYQLANGTTIFPYAWCLKRIANGTADNIWLKFQALVLQDI